MNTSKVKNSELIKHTSAIHINNTISVIERKVSNILLKKAFPHLVHKEKNSISIKEIIFLLGWTTDNNYELIKNSLKKLNVTQIEWNILKRDKKNEWGIATIISGAKIKNGICEYSYSPILRDLLSMPNIYAKLNMAIQAKFNSKYSLALWEFLIETLCSSNNSELTTKFIDLVDVRKILGISILNMYEEYKFLNRDVLKKAIAEINIISDIEVKTITQRKEKKITAIAFVIKRKKNFDYPLLDFDSTDFSEKSCDYEQEADDKLEHLLKSEFRLSATCITDLLKNYSKAQVEANINYVKQQSSNNKIRNIAAYFISSLKDNWGNDLIARHNNTKDNSLDAKMKVNRYIEDQPAIWSKVLEQLKKLMNDDVFLAWITKLEFLKYSEENQLIEMKAQSAFYRDWISNNYGKDILLASQLVIPKVNKINIHH